MPRFSKRAITSVIGNDAKQLNTDRICEPVLADFAFQQANLDTPSGSGPPRDRAEI